MNICSNTTQENCTTSVPEAGTRDEIVLMAMKRVEVMLRSYAKTHDLDFDDLYQDVAEQMLRVYDHIPEEALPVSYLFGVARIHMRLIVRKLEEKEVPTTSLDEPVFDKLTLADMLAAPNIAPMTAQEEAHIDKVTEVVHAALRECRIEEQEYACKVFELTSYTPVSPTSLSIVIRNRHCATQRRSNNIRTSIKRTFHRNPQVLSLVQHEACVL